MTKSNKSRFDLTTAQRHAVEIALKQYLEGFTATEVNDAPAGSNIGTSRDLLLEMRNRRNAA